MQGANFNIDAVILWVDGNDPTHKAKLMRHIDNPERLQAKGFKERFRQINEIEYGVKSILKFAPFINTIYIVTDGQVPGFLKNTENLDAYKNVRIVDHTTIFEGYEQYLPLFNSNAIETMVHRIPDLSEQFVYFNDDMFLFKETKPSDFFSPNGLPVIRGKIMPFEGDKWYKKIAVDLGFKKVRTKGYLGYKRKQDFFAKLMGEKKKICVDHTPFTMRKSTISSFFKENPTLLLNNIKHKFRNENNVLLQSISAYCEVKKHPSVLKEDYQMARCDSSKSGLFFIKLKLLLFEKNKNKIFLNIQDLVLYSDDKLDYIIKWLDKIYL